MCSRNPGQVALGDNVPSRRKTTASNMIRYVERPRGWPCQHDKYSAFRSAPAGSVCPFSDGSTAPPDCRQVNASRLAAINVAGKFSEGMTAPCTVLGSGSCSRRRSPGTAGRADRSPAAPRPRSRPAGSRRRSCRCWRRPGSDCRWRRRCRCGGQAGDAR
jgi:hypothetical protein